MSYSEQFAKEEKAGNVQSANVEFLQLDTDNPTVIGKIIEVREITFKSLGKPTEVLILDTDDGIKGLFVGVVAMKVAADKKNQGKLVKITYKGKIHEGEKGEYKDYDIQIARG